MAGSLRFVADKIVVSRGLGLAAAAALFAGAVYADRSTGTQIGSSLFYAVPVFLTALYLGSAAGWTLACASAAAWFALNAQPLLLAGVRPPVLVWNAVVRAIFLMVTASLARVYLRMREAQRLTELKSQMLSIVSHDLNNFVTVIKMASALLEDADGAPSSSRDRAFAALNDNVEKIGRTVADFLDLARLESGHFELKPRRVMLREFTRKLADGLAFVLERKKLALELDIPDQALPVRADPSVMTMVMGNLLSNAIKYTPQGGLVTVRLRKLDDKTAEVSVEDTGVGISEEDQEKIFSGFYRTRIGKGIARGQGLGLKITKEMAALHGGTLRVESAVGRGSRFYFTLPLWEDST